MYISKCRLDRLPQSLFGPFPRCRTFLGSLDGCWCPKGFYRNRGSEKGGSGIRGLGLAPHLLRRQVLQEWKGHAGWDRLRMSRLFLSESYALFTDREEMLAQSRGVILPPHRFSRC